MAGCGQSWKGEACCTLTLESEAGPLRQHKLVDTLTSLLPEAWRPCEGYCCLWLRWGVGVGVVSLPTPAVAVPPRGNLTLLSGEGRGGGRQAILPSNVGGVPVLDLSWPGQAFSCLLRVPETRHSGDSL